MTTQTPHPTDLRAVLTVYGHQPQTAHFLNIVDIVPESLDWIWNYFSDGCPFSFGDNNCTLVDARTMRHWIEDIVELHGTEEDMDDKAKEDLDLLTQELTLCYDARVYINVE